jgi:hypothetical protein
MTVVINCSISFVFASSFDWNGLISYVTLSLCYRYMNAEKYNLDRIYFGGCFIRGTSFKLSSRFFFFFYSSTSDAALFCFVPLLPDFTPLFIWPLHMGQLRRERP